MVDVESIAARDVILACAAIDVDAKYTQMFKKSQ